MKFNSLLFELGPNLSLKYLNISNNKLSDKLGIPLV